MKFFTRNTDTRIIQTLWNAPLVSVLESFRFWDEDDYEYEVFSALETLRSNDADDNENFKKNNNWFN